MAEEPEAGPISGDAAVESIGNFLNAEPVEDSPTDEQEEVEVEETEIESEEVEAAEAEDMDEGDADDDADEDEPPETDAIEPPSSWSDADKEVFSSLPVEAQTAIAEREADREAHLSKTNREAAQALKDAEAKGAAFEQEQQRIAEQLVPLMNALHQQIQTDAEDLQSYLDEGDTEGYLRAKHQMEQRQVMLQQAEAERQNMAQRAEAEKQQKQAERVETEGAALLEALPAWKDEKVRTAEQKRIAGYLAKQELTEDEIGSLSDHRLVLIARNAMLYDELQKAKPKVAKKVAKKPRVVKPGSPENRGDRKGKKSAAVKRNLKRNPRDRQAQSQAIAEFL